MQGSSRQDRLAETPRRQASNATQANAETERLRKQHALMLHAMDGDLVRVPLTKHSPIRILDSGTGDGTWLGDVAKRYPNASLVGTDVDASGFDQPRPELLPSRIELKTQSILEPWPQEDQEAYDLVHQRFVLALFSADKSEAAVKGLFGLVKRGGYIQLVESDLTSFDRDGHRGMSMFMDFAAKAFPEANLNNCPGRFSKDWLETAGAVDVETKQITCGMGAQADTPTLREETTDHVITMIENIESITSRIPGYWYSRADYQSLKDAVLQEMEETGNTWRYWLATGRKA
ncbi:methyltransferase GliN [Massariosphaeria phaeospora]|uniref:Methyltransferase GliN n=1 Tax=Massariosphaeria phaeospora TaxID=100035 RepID=A0A7C8M9F6_9PLEO|nr:methyltransferase GliN [Massariosphaeria phaeospora]